MRKVIEHKSRKGFSLVELIVVVAIMAALVVVMAPSMTKYVKKARDAVVTEAAEQCVSFVKTEYGLALEGEGTIRIGKGKDDPDHVYLGFESVEKDDGSKINSLSFNGKTGDDGLEEFKRALNFDEDRTCKTDLVYLIHVRYYDVDNHAQLVSTSHLEIEEETTLEKVTK